MAGRLNLGSFSAEIIATMATFLEPSDICRLMQTSTRMRDLVRDMFVTIALGRTIPVARAQEVAADLQANCDQAMSVLQNMITPTMKVRDLESILTLLDYLCWETDEGDRYNALSQICDEDSAREIFKHLEEADIRRRPSSMTI